MHLTSRFLLSITTITCICSAAAQIQQAGEPLQWSNKDLSLNDIPFIVTDLLDMETIIAEDAVVDQYKETPYRFGIERDVTIDLFSEGQYTVLPSGDKIWRLGIECPKATSINLLFSSYEIPIGGQMTIWSSDRKDYLGVFNHLNNKDYGSLAVGLVHSDRIVVEYYQKARATEQANIEIGTIVHGYRTVINKWEDLSKGPFGNSGSCNMNVNCPDGDDWQEEKRGVALILNGGSAWCTGSLINNTAQDGTSYFLTAAHCNSNENNWVFYFNHETAGCAGSSGPTTQSISGASQLASGASSDYHLIQLSNSVPASYQPYYNGWDRSNSPVSTAVGIHHPSGDVKKISFDDDPLTKTNYGSTGVNSNGTHWRVEAWERNTTTEGGSSGSPLFDQNHRIIGQLHGGTASCSSFTSDWYGAFGNSWSGMASILDPINSGAVTLDGLEGGGPPATCSDGIQNQGETDVDCGGPSCAPCPCDDGSSVRVSITFDNYPEDISWTLTSNGTLYASGSNYAGEPGGSTFIQDVCLPDGCYDFTVFDSFGDGLCCQWGNGSWAIIDADGNVLDSENSIWTSTSIGNFCVESAAACTGDLNGDGVVDSQDFVVFNSAFGQSCSDCPSDLNGDGLVNISDFNVFNTAYGTICGE